MADKLGNIAGLFKQGRTRAIVLTTVVVLVIAIIVGLFSMRSRTKGVEASAQVTSAPGGIESVPFEAPNEEYARLQEKQNTQKAQQATQTGTSAIPTIIHAGKDTGPVPGAEAAEGVGFTALSREQSDAGTFAAKEFPTGDGQIVCPGDKNTQSKYGTPVYDRDGNLIAYYSGPNIIMRDVNGKILCTAGLFGLLTSEGGKLSGTQVQGTPIYDKNGRLIGYADANGKVRDLNGNVIGTVGPDGTVRDSSGNIIGQSSTPVTGTAVYDANGNIVGYVGPDGKVRDASGRILGAPQDVGKVGTPVYDANGNLIGFAGPDGKVRDANGNVVGTVGPDGVAHDLSGNIIGKSGAISPGTPVYDANGNIVGYVGPDGKVRDANGNIVGTIGADGKLRDANGNVIGGVTKPEKTVSATPTPSSGPTEAEQDEAAYIKQQEILKDQRLTQVMQQKQQAMAAQAGQLLAAWTSPVQQYVGGESKNNQGQDQTQDQNNVNMGMGDQSQGSASATKNTGPVFIKAGTIFFGVINTSINSDEPGPVMATIVGGDYDGGKLLGSMTNQGQAVMLTFNTLTLPQFSKSIPINAVAIDQNSARTGMSTETNNHYLLRYGSLFAASFVQGYGQALTTAGGTTSTNGLTTQTTTPDLSPTQKAYVALGNVGQQFNTQMNTVFNTPPTVKVAAGTAIGVLFLGDASLPKS